MGEIVIITVPIAIAVTINITITKVAPKGIRVNSVNPGVIVTGIFEKVIIIIVIIVVVITTITMIITTIIIIIIIIITGVIVIGIFVKAGLTSQQAAEDYEARMKKMMMLETIMTMVKMKTDNNNDYH